MCPTTRKPADFQASKDSGLHPAVEEHAQRVLAQEPAGLGEGRLEPIGRIAAGEASARSVAVAHDVGRISQHEIHGLGRQALQDLAAVSEENLIDGKGHGVLRRRPDAGRESPAVHSRARWTTFAHPSTHGAQKRRAGQSRCAKCTVGRAPLGHRLQPSGGPSDAACIGNERSFTLRHPSGVSSIASNTFANRCRRAIAQLPQMPRIAAWPRGPALARLGLDGGCSR